ncbi:hypothetical protein [Chitinophaga nivalis]|uniref:Uncharacterized protein n=1 Tax=Chitinophaga nivalis TaxID=2991709 RepID=A0ABT3III2_9BACT|nr:hypothetical protein [Chitinophaga nivalis]MCW3466543.1 hypothetical protein [Chitinophaga nivalis]MCW3483766.1 hypothetical protein [Chitinophaga nivalis]
MNKKEVLARAKQLKDRKEELCIDRNKLEEELYFLNDKIDVIESEYELLIEAYPEFFNIEN